MSFYKKNSIFGTFRDPCFLHQAGFFPKTYEVVNQSLFPQRNALFVPFLFLFLYRLLQLLSKQTPKLDAFQFTWTNSLFDRTSSSRTVNRMTTISHLDSQPFSLGTCGQWIFTEKVESFTNQLSGAMTVTSTL